jgi:hypothetical protein
VHPATLPLFTSIRNKGSEMSVIQAQEAFIDQVNSCVRPLDRMHRVRRSANRTLAHYLASVGYSEQQISQAQIDAWDVAELQNRSDA